MIRKIVKINAEKCNGCGACAAACLEDAICFEEREAAAFDKEAVKRNQEQKMMAGVSCSGIQMQTFARPAVTSLTTGNVQSELRQWPVQIVREELI